MKSRRIFITCFVLVAAMLMGVGYAVLTDSFIIDGNAVIEKDKQNIDFDSKIYLTSPKAESTTGTSGIADSASIASDNNDKGSFTVKSLAMTGEISTFTFVVQNDSQFDANIAVTLENASNADYFAVNSTVSNNGLCVAGGSVTITITVELIKEVTDRTESNFTFNYTATTTE